MRVLGWGMVLSLMTPVVADAVEPWVDVEWLLGSDSKYTSCGALGLPLEFGKQEVDAQVYKAVFTSRVDDAGIHLEGTLSTEGRSGKPETYDLVLVTPVDGETVSTTVTVPSPRGYRGPDGQRQKTLTWTLKAHATSPLDCFGMLPGSLIGAKGTQTVAPAASSTSDEEPEASATE